MYSAPPRTLRCCCSRRGRRLREGGTDRGLRHHGATEHDSKLEARMVMDRGAEGRRAGDHDDLVASRGTYSAARSSAGIDAGTALGDTSSGIVRSPSSGGCASTVARREFEVRYCAHCACAAQIARSSIARSAGSEPPIPDLPLPSDPASLSPAPDARIGYHHRRQGIQVIHHRTGKNSCRCRRK